MADPFHYPVIMNIDDDDEEEPDTVRPPPILPEENQNGNVSILNRCESLDAKQLYIYNLHTQKGLDYHDIGGTYSNGTPELWFSYTTMIQPKCFLLLNLFVCHRKTGSFSIGVPNSNTFEIKNNICTLPTSLAWYHFRSVQNDEVHYIKTFQLTLKEFKSDDEILTTTLVMPLNIHQNPPFALNAEILESIKLKHNLRNSFYNQEASDFTIMADSGKEYPVHKILIASHSSVLKQLMKDKNILRLDTSESNIDLLIEYIYNGTLKNIEKYTVFQLLEIVHKFQIKPLLVLIDYLIEKDLTVDNAVEMALIAKRYKLQGVKSKVFNYIKNNPDVMNSTGWKGLNDVELAKSIFQYVLTNKIV